MKISFVIPVHNEQDNLLPLFDEITRMADAERYEYEVIFVDDGSRDGSLGVLKALAREYPAARYLSLAANRGQSAALGVGFAHAAGDVIITMDADGQNDPADVPAMMARYGEGCDMVTGWRRNRRDTLSKRLGSRIGNGIRNRLTGESIHDTGCSLKVMRADMVKRIKMFKGMHRFLPTLMRLEGARVVEMEVNHRPRRHGTSNYTNWRRAREGFFDLLAVRWMQRRYQPATIGERHV
ncbi:MULTISPECIES: glycosyltransferase family 2 protein [Geobacter]|uniref:Glycosyl transferase n=2 Tax=Geobacter TaxID=28231 RepID=A0A0C1U1D8_9BACT|nr:MULTISPECIES: glycosyltransferase family 2 protein [Geobacter]ANA39796.1 glycosyl transferase [Geobacter anodireducens]KIE41600.1 glycosyl transferase [Geobacter soli]MBE2887497.1 glycosyltransferase family 2 protein [Geobacter anodireducens]HMN01854.1 glycosyltransferase family 2 protein [Geobacter anodireducens]